MGTKVINQSKIPALCIWFESLIIVVECLQNIAGGNRLEFGAKISVSLVNGYSFLDHLSWDNFNEASDLKHHLEDYHRRFGVYPESVHADQIYRNRDNIRFCKEHGIRLSGAALGRPSKLKEIQKEVKNQMRQDELARISIEGKFGQGRRRFILSNIICKLVRTPETAIAVVFW